ncbi:MAG TPA: DUF1003 domain-containing protein, partial [Pyrinomonadaceae bacterium]|nr:DUF1003 domain-containing protein [Pyrinomonadaceae bacterium]
MTEKAEQLAKKFLRREWEKLTERERRVIQSFVERKQVSRNLSKAYDDDRTFGERLADRVASFGGSWTFIFIFGAILVAWVIINSVLLLNRAFDPYPYILLNLFLSMIAALQAPIIMMSQNRQAARDRLDATHDYEVNLKAELEIRDIHDKLDDLREQKWLELVELQQEQIRLL